MVVLFPIGMLVQLLMHISIHLQTLDSTSAIFCYENAFINATDNWWGTNNPDFNSLISTMYGGSVDTSNWLYMNITSD